MRNKGICTYCVGIGACGHGGRPLSVGIRKRTRPVTGNDVAYIVMAETSLAAARHYLRWAGAHHAAARVRAALKSTQGALNHARAMLARQKRAELRG